ncbi:hypothetical protein C8A01DRAFT_31760 [Parachaetomium inaequale]|uniref:Uncharacterized protein n=1 Tax=Parachaetomium inaequale TaxID=2588326 RepID=A0AAN6PQK2_9PEZI|nr:hypothetical protein C8A01DRAFT_31760 [Parachaetomium inaequale]
MAFMNYDVTLLLAEHIDMDSMASFMLSSKANYRLIRGYEQSIVKAKIAKIVHDPMLMPPLGSLLSSAAPGQSGFDRMVLEPVSFAVAKELESRQHQINTLFSSGSPNPCSRPELMETINRLALFQNLPPNQMERLTDGLKDACAVADRIADCAAFVHLKQKPKTGCLKEGRRSVEHEAHLARQRYIRSLPPIRLAFLTLLASLVGMEYASQRLQSADSDPFWSERVTSVKETFLRHGTVVICALLCPFEAEAEAADTSSSTRPGDSDACRSLPARSESARYYTSQVTEVLGELLEYEGWHWGTSRPAEQDGDARPIPDSLHMTMLQAFQSPEDAEEVDQSPDLEAVEKEDDADAGWLFNIDILDHGTDDGGDNPSPLMAAKPDAREALILKWIKQG